MSTRKTRPTARRTYDSSRRQATAEQNRAAVYAAAADLFAAQGWKATGMRDIAKAAGVSVETVYSTAGTKSDLLLRVIDIGIVGDEDPVALADRPDFQALGSGSRSERLVAAAELITASNRRIARLNRTFAHGAAADHELAERWQESQQTQRAQYALAVHMMLGREPRTDVVDGVWALGSADVYLLLVETAGWSAEHYRDWLVDQLDHQLFRTSRETS